MGFFDDLFSDDDTGDGPVEQTGNVATLSNVRKAKEAVAATNGTHAPPSKHTYLYLDLETCPDYSRLDQFDLPALPPRKDKNLMSAVEFCSQGLAEIKKFFEENLPSDSWLDNIEAEERSQKKPRAGLFDAVAKARGQVEQQRKTLSVTPEYCRIVAFCMKASSNVSIVDVLKDQDDEKEFLIRFWQLAKDTRTIVGFNCLVFDLPVILTRSALLGVTPSRRINLSPYRNTDVCDLMVARYPRGGQMGLKRIAKALGIEIPADDCDGSQVEHLYNTDPEKLKQYVASDVEVTREVHRLLSGYFWE